MLHERTAPAAPPRPVRFCPPPPPPAFRRRTPPPPCASPPPALVCPPPRGGAVRVFFVRGGARGPGGPTGPARARSGRPRAPGVFAQNAHAHRSPLGGRGRKKTARKRPTRKGEGRPNGDKGRLLPPLYPGRDTPSVCCRRRVPAAGHGWSCSRGSSSRRDIMGFVGLLPLPSRSCASAIAPRYPDCVFVVVVGFERCEITTPRSRCHPGRGSGVCR